MSAVPSTPTTGAATAGTATKGEVLLSVRDMQVHFPMSKGLFDRKAARMLRAVDGVSLDIRQGETLGLVGEPTRSTCCRTAG